MKETLTRQGVSALTVHGTALAGLLAAVSTHAHKSEDLPALNAVRVWTSEGRLYAAATDRYRLIEGYCDLVKAGEGEDEGELAPTLIRLSDIKRIVALVPAKGRLVFNATISRAGDMVSVAYGSDSLTLTAWDAQFPPYEHLFPTGETVPLSGIKFNPTYFADYGKIVGKNQPVGVRFYGDSKPIEIELGEGWRALLMPMRKG